MNKIKKPRKIMKQKKYFKTESTKNAPGIMRQIYNYNTKLCLWKIKDRLERYQAFNTTERDAARITFMKEKSGQNIINL